MTKTIAAVGAVLIAALLIQPTQASETVTTSDGRQVILRSDGTWSYATDTVAASKESRGGPDLRNVRWGESMDRVRAVETSAFYAEQESLLGYSDTLAGFPTLVGYVFVEDKLVRAKLIFQKKRANKLNCFYDFDTIEKIITMKYGSPARSDTLWTGDLYRKRPTQWGMALKTGSLMLVTTWETDRTKIKLILSGENYDVTLAAEYKSRALMSLEQKSRDNEDIQDF